MDFQDTIRSMPCLKTEKSHPSPLLGAHSCMPDMPFGLMNTGETFQRAMDIAFIGEKDKFVIIYLDGYNNLLQI
jgi:hypothetical protein